MIRPPATPREWARARRVLLCLRWGIGDLVMQWPLLAALRDACPEAEIVALGAEPATGLLGWAGRPVDRVVTVQSLGFHHYGDKGEHGGTAGFDAWFDRETRAGGFDLVLDALHAGVGLRDGLWRHGVAACESDQGVLQDRLECGEGMVRAILESARIGWGLPGEAGHGTLSSRFDLTAGERRWADDWLGERGIDAPPAAVSPVASLELKRWPVDRLAAVADDLADEGGRVLVFAGLLDEAATRTVQHMRRRDAAVIVGAEPLRRVAALLARCRVLVCNDTGLLHLGQAVGTRAVGVFGPTQPRVFFARAGERSWAASGRPCEHRNDVRGDMPACWAGKRCLLDVPGGCVTDVAIGEVIASARLAVSGRCSTNAAPLQ